MSPGAEGEDAESPMPLPQISSAVRRRGAISAEPITEEDVATYVKKVKWQLIQLICGHSARALCRIFLKNHAYFCNFISRIYNFCYHFLITLYVMNS